MRKVPRRTVVLLCALAVVSVVVIAYLVAPGHPGGNYSVIREMDWEIQAGPIKASAFTGGAPGSDVGRYVQVGPIRVNHWF